MTDPQLAECCDACGEAGHMLADPTMHYVGSETLCGECYREHLAATEPAAYLEHLWERHSER